MGLQNAFGSAGDTVAALVSQGAGAAVVAEDSDAAAEFLATEGECASAAVGASVSVGATESVPTGVIAEFTAGLTASATTGSIAECITRLSRDVATNSVPFAAAIEAAGARTSVTR